MSDESISDTFNPAHKKPIQRWYRDVAIRQQSHSELAESYDGKERLLTTWSVGLNAIASSVIFTTISSDKSVSSDPDPEIAMFHKMTTLAGIIAAINTILQAMTQSLQYAESAEQHQQAFRQFTHMRFRLESIFGNHYHDDEHIDRIFLNDWIKEYRDLLESSPLIPQSVFVRQAAKEDAAWKIQVTKKIMTTKTNDADLIQIERPTNRRELFTFSQTVTDDREEIQTQVSSDIANEENIEMRSISTLAALAFM